jgi:hypothetical protein
MKPGKAVNMKGRKTGSKAGIAMKPTYPKVPATKKGGK